MEGTLAGAGVWLALEYAAANDIIATVQEPKKRSANIRTGGYGENFATNRRGAWTH